MRAQYFVAWSKPSTKAQRIQRKIGTSEEEEFMGFPFGVGKGRRKGRLGGRQNPQRRFQPLDGLAEFGPDPAVGPAEQAGAPHDGFDLAPRYFQALALRQ